MMTCARVRSRLSDWIDGSLTTREARAVERHVTSCEGCSRHAVELRELGRLLAGLQRLEAPEPIAGRVLDRLEIETRQPALAFLFRGFSAARPFMLPSLVPAVLVLVSVLAGVLALDSGPLPEVHFAPGAWRATPASGTEGNPLFPSADVDLPRETTAVDLPTDQLSGSGEGTLFLETVVARDGSVADVTLLAGNAERAVAVVDALRRQRFEPVRYRGRPVAVSVYRLISRVEIHAPVT